MDICNWLVDQDKIWICNVFTRITANAQEPSSLLSRSYRFNVGHVASLIFQNLGIGKLRDMNSYRIL